MLAITTSEIMPNALDSFKPSTLNADRRICNPRFADEFDLNRSKEELTNLPDIADTDMSIQISTEKGEMITTKDKRQHGNAIDIDVQDVEEANSFKDLGAVMTADCRSETETD